MCMFMNIWTLYGAANLKLSCIFVFHCKAIHVGSFPSKVLMQYREFRLISVVNILDVKQPTRMKFQSFSNYVINYMCIGETFCMLVTNVFCKETVSTAQVVVNTRPGWNHLILFVNRSIPHLSVLLRLLPWSLKTCVKASFFKYCDIISCSWYKQI